MHGGVQRPKHGSVAFNAVPNLLLLNKICLKQSNAVLNQSLVKL